MFVCQEPLDEVRNDQNFLSGLVTGDKTWFTLTNWNPRAVLAVETPILTTSKESQECQVEHQEPVGDFFCKVIVYQEFVPRGRLVKWHSCNI
jgi:hypothetical protein